MSIVGAHDEFDYLFRATDYEGYKMKKMRWELLAVLIVIVWLSVSLGRVENQRYAMQIGMCKDVVGGWDYSCLSKVETRTSWLWHIYYALLN